METKNLLNGEIGFEVKDIKDILAAKSLGMGICNEDAYYFDEYTIEEDADGEEVEREPTEDEKMNRIIEGMKDGAKIYATCSIPGGYTLVAETNTIFQSDFYVRQDVYILHDNRIIKAKVVKVQMVRSWSGANGQSIKTESKYEVQYVEFGRMYNVIVGNDNIFESVEKLTEHLTSNIRG